MAKDTKKKRENELREAVRGAQPSVLAKLVLDLCELSDDNRAFVGTRLAATRDPLIPYKQRIDDALYPDVFSRKPIRIAAARKAISEYQRAGGSRDGLLELMIFFSSVEPRSRPITVTSTKLSIRVSSRCMTAF